MRRFRDLTTKEKKEYLAILFLLPFAYIWHLFRKATFRTLSRRAVAVCLSAVMVITLLPTLSIPANAASALSFTMERNIYSIRAAQKTDDTSRNNDSSRNPSTYVGLKSTRSGNTVTITEEDGPCTNYRVTYDGYTIKVTVPAYSKYKVTYSVAVTLKKEKYRLVSNKKIAMAEVLTPNSASEVFTLNTNDSGTSSPYSIGKLSGSDGSFTKSGTYSFSRTFDNTTNAAKTYEAYVGFATAAHSAAANCTVTGTFTTSVTYENVTPGYTVKYNANGGSGSMANQCFTRGQAKNLTSNAFTYTPKITFNENGGNAVSDAAVSATFGGWEDRSTTTFGGTTYKYTDFDAPGYAARNSDVFNHVDFGNGFYNKDGLLNHYVNYGKAEYNDGSTSRAPNTGYIYGYPNGAKVSNLTTMANGTVNLYAKWKYGKTTLPTPTRTGYTFKGWTGDLMDIATLTGGMEISDTSRGTIGSNASYAVTENLIPVVGGATYTSNYEVCGLYSFDANGNFIKRESSYATTHTVSSNAAFVRIEVNTTKGITFDQYQSGLTLTYTLPAGTAFPVGGNQTLTAQWQVNSYTNRIDPNGGYRISDSSTEVVTYDKNYGDTEPISERRRTGYTLTGYKVTNSTNGSTTDLGGAVFTFDSSAKTATLKQGTVPITLTAQWSANTYTVTWKNHDGSVLETDTGVTHGTTPAYNGATPQKAEDENFTYTFNGWSPALEAVTGDVEYVAQFTAVSKRVEPTYTVTIPATVNEGESFKVSATEVVLNTDQTLTVTLQSDFTLTNEQGAKLGFKINDGAIVNNTQLISVTGNGDKNNPLSFTTENLVVEIAEEAKYSGTYTGTLTFTIAVNTAENN